VGCKAFCSEVLDLRAGIDPGASTGGSDDNDPLAGGREVDAADPPARSGGREVDAADPLARSGGREVDDDDPCSGSGGREVDAADPCSGSGGREMGSAPRFSKAKCAPEARIDAGEDMFLDVGSESSSRKVCTTSAALAVPELTVCIFCEVVSDL
jgi:hypothetical protein